MNSGRIMPDSSSKKKQVLAERKRYVFGQSNRYAASILIVMICDFVTTLILSLSTELSAYAITFINVVFLGLVAYLLLKSIMHNPIANRYDKLSGALVDAEQKSKSLLKMAANLIVALNEKGIIIDCNDKVASVLGYSPSHIIGESVLKIIHSDYIARIQKSFGKLTMDKTLHNREVKMLRKDGQLIETWVNSTSIKDRLGNFVMSVWIIEDVTVRKRTEEILRLTQFSIDRCLDAVFWMGPDAKFINVNDAACDALGYTRDQLLTMSVYDIDPDFPPEVWAAHWIDLKTRKSFVFETRHKTRTGRLFPVEVAVNYLEYNGREYNCVFARDISDRKSVEIETKSAIEQLKTSIDHMPIAYLLWDTHYRVREWNKAAEHIFGFAREEVLGKSLPDLIVPLKIRPVIIKILDKLKEGENASFPVENSNIRKDGSLISCYWHNTPLKDKEGGIFGVLSMAEDITDQIRVKKELEIVNEKFRELTDMLPQTIFELDLDGRVIYTNRYGLEFSGYTPDDLDSGILAENLFIPEERRRLRKYLVKLLRGKKIDGTEFIMLKKNGNRANVMVYANPVFGPEGIVGIRGILADITESKRLHEFASRAQRLEIAGRIAGQVAHDFNNLLGPLFAFPEFIRESLAEDDPAIRYLEHIENAAEQMAEINQQLLTLGRRGHYSQVPLNLNEIILQTIERIKSLSDKINVTTVLSTDLKAIRGGASQISRMISNLVDNAVEAMNKVGYLNIQTENYRVDRLWSRYGRVPEGDYVKLTIADSGCGIPESNLAHIFEPFFTTKTAESKKGSGLGLSIVQAVMEDHGGYIDVKSEIGNGTSFYLYFPVAGSQPEIERPEEMVGGSEKVLVVDDDPLQREVTSNLLRKLGYDISIVSSGEEAVEFIRNNPQDIVLLDMVMSPGIDGTETFKRIIELYPQQKALIISGYADSEKIEIALELGILGFVGKPLSLKSIASAIRKALEGKLVNV